ncbi:hypothetical protein BJX99DRAFT_264959 [Aspergillus californicus]
MDISSVAKVTAAMKGVRRALTRFIDPGIRFLEANLAELRDIDWGLDKHGEPVVQTANLVQHIGAVLLQKKGEVQTEPIVGLEYRGLAVFAGACASCLWHNKGKNSSVRTSRGMNNWSNSITTEVEAAGGLDAALEAASRFEPTDVGDSVPRKGSR